MYYVWLSISLTVSLLLTWCFFPSSFGEFPLFGDITTLIFIPGYFVLYSTLISILQWRFKIGVIKGVLVAMVIIVMLASSVMLFKQNYSNATSYIFTFVGASVGLCHFSILEALRKRMLMRLNPASDIRRLQ